MSSKTSNGDKPTLEINVALMGLSAVEQNLISGICKLSRFRAGVPLGRTLNRYSIVGANQASEIDIFLVDADAHDVIQTRESIRDRLSKITIIWVSNNDIQTSTAGEYHLTRNRLGGALLKLLDEISDEHRQKNALKTPLKTCLVVDDSELMRTQMELILKECGLGVALAGDAETAIQMVKEHPFDLIFLDVMLPEMDGYKACKHLKSDPKTKKTPVVMLTSKSSPFNKMHGALVGCDRYLTKPMDANKVRQVLEQYLLIDKNTAAKA